MRRITEHSKTTFFKDSDVIINGERLGPAAFECERFYQHYVYIINRLAELEDKYCKPQTNADKIRSMTNDELADMVFYSPFKSRQDALNWMKQAADNSEEVK